MNHVSKLISGDFGEMNLESIDGSVERFALYSITIDTGNSTIPVTNDIAFEVFTSLYYSLNNPRPLPSELSPGKLGMAWNREVWNLSEEPVSSDERIGYNFSVWSSDGNISFIYEWQGQLYLEVAGSYPWMWEEPNSDDPQYQTFEEFIDRYVPLALIQLDRETVVRWKRLCEGVLDQIRNIEASRSQPDDCTET